MRIIKICCRWTLKYRTAVWPNGLEEGLSLKIAHLYDNRFSKILALTAFTGCGSSVRTSLASCPEFTTNGMLPKCWRRTGGKIRLYKGGTRGGYNTGNELYSKFYATPTGTLETSDFSLITEQMKLQRLRRCLTTATHFLLMREMMILSRSKLLMPMPKHLFPAYIMILWGLRELSLLRSTGRDFGSFLILSSRNIRDTTFRKRD